MKLDKSLAQIKKHGFTKELKDYEYETKFEIINNILDNLGVLKKVQECLRKKPRLILSSIKRGDKLIARVSFFVKD